MDSVHERVQQHTGEQIVDSPVLQILDESVVVVQGISQGSVSERISEQIVDVPVKAPSGAHEFRGSEVLRQARGGQGEDRRQGSFGELLRSGAKYP